MPSRIRGPIHRGGWGSAPDPGIFSGMSPMSQSRLKKCDPGREFPYQGLTRPGRIGDRDIPRQVACQQSLPPFFPAPRFDTQIQPLSSHLGHRRNALKMPGGAEPPFRPQNLPTNSGDEPETLGSMGWRGMYDDFSRNLHRFQA